MSNFEFTIQKLNTELINKSFQGYNKILKLQDMNTYTALQNWKCYVPVESTSIVSGEWPFSGHGGWGTFVTSWTYKGSQPTPASQARSVSVVTTEF